MDTTTLPDEPAVATDTPPTWSEPFTRRLADGLGTGRGEQTRVPNAAEKPGEPSGRVEERDGRPRAEPPELDHEWLLVAPLAGAVALTVISALVEPNPLRTGTSPSGLLAFAVLIPFFLVCVAGTLALVRDASAIRAAGLDWSPNPWQYVAPSAAALSVLHAARVVRGSGSVEGIVGVAAGTLVVALATASILAGPAYLLRRRRRLGGD